jgi:hypothetical protein
LTTSGAEVLVRYPIAHVVGQQITKHTNKHIIWTIVEPRPPRVGAGR